jgi:hypothetical protein
MAFKDKKDREAFWQEIREVFDRHRQLVDGVEDILAGEEDADGMLYDPSTPKFIDGIAIVFSVRNLEGFETSCLLFPPGQSYFMTMGLLGDKVLDS